MEKSAIRFSNRNRITFGLGTIGRDMVYSLISMYLIFFLTEIKQLSNNAMWWITGIILVARIFDAFNDPIMGVIVDNTRSRFGKFKPWITFGAFTSGIFTILIFMDYGLSEAVFVPIFAVLYLLWGITYTANDISYWSMMPSLTTNPHEREEIGAFARICANIGLFAVVAGIVPLTNALGDQFGSMYMGYLIFSVLVVIIMWVGQFITVVGVVEPKRIIKEDSHTSLHDLVTAIFKNDQLMVTGISMALFMIGYTTTASFGLYFFKYAYGDEGMYSIFALILGISQIIALAFFPILGKKVERKILYRYATILVVVGYIIFFFSPMNMIYIGLAGILLFVGQAFIQILMLMFLADTIEYGQLKLGRRNESVTFSIQPFINKMGGAIASGVVGVTVILSGINDAVIPSDVSKEGLFLLKLAMMIFPLICIFSGYMIYRKRYIIDAKLYDDILKQLRDKGDLL
ncbi:glycoside-pentoside-hexuronide (GPH):cation symporter [Fusibacter bizertensis]|uniref:Glycoside-pentoside-hexuronide (GPH):cation symporter n=1 Tax=Fusibacter bizertensis TaxID=1488331 RepID=A0ABT6ND30_9FIRM|nr:glycoside-pentoside-hexuronide (GPH):cation symporter [Fusibacter bizertensis]MDH8678296.1 glycoside-pentoside-hexuronide (GPH):cation symporter [Fusibacter bizertensis]